MALASVIAGLTALPQIVAGVDSVISLFGGGGGFSPSAVTSVGGPGFPRAGTATQGTSVGPPVFADPTGANLGGAVPAIVRALPRILPAIGGGVVGSVGSSLLLPPAPAPRVMTQKQFILATARAFQPGATAKKILRSARECGIELAAATFGLDVLQVCFLISQPATRRSRGISAASVRTTRRTMRQVNALKNLCPPARRRKH